MFLIRARRGPGEIIRRANLRSREPPRITKEGTRTMIRADETALFRGAPLLRPTLISLLR